MAGAVTAPPAFPPTRRFVLAGAAAAVTTPAGAAGPAAANQWFALRGDDGHPVPNARAPVEVTEEIEDLTGAIWAGPRDAAVKLVEFYDYNCPWCRAAEAARIALRRDNSDLRLGLVNNPILSAASAEAARIELAVLALGGAGASYALHERLFATPGRIDGARALEAAVALGHAPESVRRAAASAPVRDMLNAQLRVAASLGLVATPSYVVAGATVLGFPGPRTLAGIVEAARRCGALSC